MATLDGLYPPFRRAVEAMLADPEAVALGLSVQSGFRSIARQQELWDAALRKYGSAEAADDWVARPGQSNHGPRYEGYGTAVDFGVWGVTAVKGQWSSDIDAKVKQIAARHGLHHPMAWEDWHYEPDWTSPVWKAVDTPTTEEDPDMTGDQATQLTQVHAAVGRLEQTATLMIQSVARQEAQQGRMEALLNRIATAVEKP
jgi:hypothetical protein